MPVVVVAAPQAQLQPLHVRRRTLPQLGTAVEDVVDGWRRLPPLAPVVPGDVVFARAGRLLLLQLQRHAAQQRRAVHERLPAAADARKGAPAQGGGLSIAGTRVGTADGGGGATSPPAGSGPHLGRHRRHQRAHRSVKGTSRKVSVRSVSGRASMAARPRGAAREAAWQPTGGVGGIVSAGLRSGGSWTAASAGVGCAACAPNAAGRRRRIVLLGAAFAWFSALCILMVPAPARWLSSIECLICSSPGGRHHLRRSSLR